MQPVYYVTNEKPKSHNSGGKSQEYKKMHSDRFTELYSHLYSGLPTRETPLQSKIIYIHHNLKKGTVPDVDNLSKPIVDAFTGVIYEDDIQIVRREADRLELEDLAFVTIDMTNIPYEIANDLDTFITDQEEHIVFFAVSKMEYKDIRIGEI